MIIQKFGGVCLQNKEMRKLCIEAIRDALTRSNKVIVVVSAIGRKENPYSTDRLLTISDDLQADAKARDLIASCGELIATAILSAELHANYIPNTFLQGAQTGIQTAEAFGRASIQSIQTPFYEQYFEEYDCIIVPGFQGLNKKGEVMTLGRGGSDLTAVALADALQATHVEFYKDVAGIFNADPAINAACEKYEQLTYDAFLSSITAENSVLQRKAVMWAKEKAIPLYVKGIASSETGTWIHC